MESTTTGQSAEGDARTSDAGPKLCLKILSTTDIHGHLRAYDYYQDRPNARVGLSRVASVIDRVRAEVPEALLLDSGDFLQGTPLADEALAAGTRPNPVIAAMNFLKYDAATLGNHEFNFGLERLGVALDQAQFPVVSANIHGHGLPVSPGLVLVKELSDETGTPRIVRIGLLGLAPPQIMGWDRRHLQGRMTVEDIATAANRESLALRQAGADLVVALCHSGIGVHPGPKGAENVALCVARCPNIDLVLAGHTHDPACCPGNAEFAPHMIAGCWGSHLGEVDLTLTLREGRWQVTDSQLRLIQMVDEPAEEWPPLTDLLEAAHAKAVAQARKPVGQCAEPLHTYFAQVGPCSALELVARAQSDEVRQQLAGTDWATLPLLSAVAPFKVGGRSGPHHYTDIPAGSLSLRDIASLYLYPNTLCAAAITGRDLRAWLERVAQQFQRVRPGVEDQSLLATDFPGHDFDVLYGATYTIDLAHPPGSRITDLTYQGQAVGPEDRFVVATNTYRTGGGGGFPVLPEDQIVFESGMLTRDILRGHLADRPLAPLSHQRVFSFAPVSGASVRFETGAGAKAHATEAASLGLTPLGLSPNGFFGYRMAL